MVSVRKRLLSYSRFIKIEHTMFALPLLFSGAVLAAHKFPGWRLSALIVGAGFGGRTVAFALNRIIDREIDQRNPRTATRELPQKALFLVEAWTICLVGLAIYLGCARAIAPFCLRWSPIPLLIFVLYPYLKRITPLAHFGVGLADAMAPLGGWMAVTQSWHPFWPGFWLSVFTFFWVSGFDVIYSTMDEAFDRGAGLHSLPARFGSVKALKISGWMHAAAFLVLGILYATSLHSGLGFAALMGIGGLLFFEHRQAADVDLAFFKINAVLGFGVLGLITAGVFL